MADLLRPNRVLDKLRNGSTASCIKMNLADPRVAQIAAICGIDCVWIDTEHVPNSIRDVENCVRAAYAHGTDAIVRVMRGGYSDMIRPLEMDAAGIMVPHVMSAKDAQEVVKTTRFHPLGQRPLDGGNADGAFGQVDINEYMQHANTQKLIIVQIEDVEALDELDQIASVEGIDMIFFGPGDFSQSIGRPGKFDDPRIEDARIRVAEAAAKHGKYAGTVGTPTTGARLVELGYQFLSLGADVVGLGEYFTHVASALHDVKPKSAASVVYR